MCCVASVGAVHIDSTVSVVGFEGQSKGGGCHEANDHSRDNGCAKSDRFCSCTDQKFGCAQLFQHSSVCLFVLVDLPASRNSAGTSLGY